MDSFVVYALVAGVGVALFMGPLGVFIVWRRMAYFGDSVAHSALLGVVLGVVLDVDLTTGTVAVCLTMALMLVFLRQRQRLADDTLLGILAHSSFALGLVTISFVATLRVDLMGYLFGDILAVSPADIAWIYAGGACALTALAFLWRPLLAITVHEELARVEGVNVIRTQAAFMLVIALVIALAMKVVGILLVTSLLIIPAATARRFARTPERMASFAALYGCAAVGLGIEASLLWDLPSGPAIVVSAAALFLLTALPTLTVRRRSRLTASREADSQPSLQ